MSEPKKEEPATEKLNLANVDWYSVLTRIGVPAELIENPRKLGMCPIEMAGATRFRFENGNGRGRWFCNQCGTGDGVRLIAKVLNISDVAAIWEIKKLETNFVQLPVREMSSNRPKEAVRDVKKIEWSLKKTLSQCVPVKPSDAVGSYISRRVPFLDLNWVHPDIQFSPRLYHFDEELSEKNEDGSKAKRDSFHPAMVAKVTSHDGKLVTLHRTYLSQEGFKANVTPSQVKKLMTGVTKLNGEAIHLNVTSTKSRTLCVTEGIETGYAVVACKRNEHDVWAAINAGNLSRLVIPRERYDNVEIYADKDALNPKTGHRVGEFYGQILADRLKSEGFGVVLKVPEQEGTDFCDLWLNHCNQKKLKAA